MKLISDEQVDAIAKRASEEPQDEAEVPLEAAISAINRTVHQEWREKVLSTSESTPNSTLGWYLKCEGRAKLDHGDTIKRKESRIIEQLRMGKSPILAKTRNDIGIDDSPMCPHCHEEEETAEHLLLTCPRWTAARLDLFGPNPEPRDVFKDPRTLVTFLKRVGAMPSI